MDYIESGPETNTPPYRVIDALDAPTGVDHSNGNGNGNGNGHPKRTAETLDTLVHEEDRTKVILPDDSEFTRTLSEIGVRNLPIGLGDLALRSPDHQLKFPSFRRVWNPKVKPEVEVETTVTEEQLRSGAPGYYDRVKRQSRKLNGIVVASSNTTVWGGGVAEMEDKVVAYSPQFGIEHRWLPTGIPSEISKITKANHSAFQVPENKMPEHVGMMSDADFQDHYDWSAAEFERLGPEIAKADIFIAHDWQMVIVGAMVKEKYPHVKVIFRNHIATKGPEMTQPGTHANDRWERYKPYALKADLLVWHPSPEFMPSDLPKDKVVLHPAFYDIFSDHNRPLGADELEVGINGFNEGLAINNGQSPLGLNSPVVAQLARFCESKGYENLVNAGGLAIRMMRQMPGVSESDRNTQFAFNGVKPADDPSSDYMLKKIMGILRQPEFQDVKDQFKVARTSHNDLIRNALQTVNYAGTNLSIAEAWEHAPSEGLEHGTPQVVAKRGGLPYQVVNGETGFIVDPDDIQGVADAFVRLITDKELYSDMKKAIAMRKEDTRRVSSIGNIGGFVNMYIAVLYPDSHEAEALKRGVRWAQDLDLATVT